jgi:hypothetical protein
MVLGPPIEQGTADILAASIMMLIIALLQAETEPLVQVKAAWLLINMTSTRKSPLMASSAC